MTMFGPRSKPRFGHASGSIHDGFKMELSATVPSIFRYQSFCIGQVKKMRSAPWRNSLYQPSATHSAQSFSQFLRCVLQKPQSNSILTYGTSSVMETMTSRDHRAMFVNTTTSAPSVRSLVG